MSKTYHFIGIKGSGMSALALMLHQMGHKVQLNHLILKVSKPCHHKQPT